MRIFSNTKTTHFRIISALVLLVSLVAPFAWQNAHAGTLSSTYLKLNRIKTGQTTDMRLVFTTSASPGTVAKVQITMTGFTVNVTQTVSSASCVLAGTNGGVSGATALPGSLTATGDNTTKKIIISGVTTLAASTKYCVDITSSSAVTNPTSGNYTAPIETETSGAAALDTTTVGTNIIADDQIVVSAVVPPSFTIALGANVDSLGTINPGTRSLSSGVTVTITSNASQGWIAWVKSLNVGLKSATASNYTIATSGTIDGAPTLIAANADGYVLDVIKTTDFAGGGTVTIDPEYNDGGAPTTTGGTLSTTLQPIASSTGTAGGDVLTLKELAAVASTTPAANDYTDTLTVIGAGNF